jgi:lysophospholipase L1-like esterase
VVLLPYEMQVSAEAATKYWELGIRWEDGFLDGLPQQRLVQHFSALVRAFDARDAFLNDGSLGPSQENGLGQYFVYDRGDKLDWNHPNREGHRLIARWLAEQAFLDGATSPGDRPVGGHRS